MGNVTVAVLYNDHQYEIAESGPVGARIAEAMRDFPSRGREAGRFGTGAIISCDHASGEQVVLVTGRTGWRVEDAPEIGWQALDQMRRCLERHGYAVRLADLKPDVFGVMLEALHKVRQARDVHDEPGDEVWAAVITAIAAAEGCETPPQGSST